MKGYPPNWAKVRDVIRRIAGWRCEWCGAKHGERTAKGKQVIISVHHAGVPYADGRPGNPHDKYDVRRENLVALCGICHFQADLPLFIKHRTRERARKRYVRLYGPIVLLLPAPTNARSEHYAA